MFDPHFQNRDENGREYEQESKGERNLEQPTVLKRTAGYLWNDKDPLLQTILKMFPNK